MAGTVGAILLAGISLYAILAGADFGGGFWDLVAGGDRQGAPARGLIEESITPVWEANHVWLVFDLVIFWTAFPHAFAAVMTVLSMPLWLALGGIVLRGSGFAFRKEISRPSLVRAAGATFAFSSLMTPFFMGAVIGGIATGDVRVGATSGGLDVWTNTTSLLSGLLFVAACAYLAAVYLTREASRRGQPRLHTYFARRAQGAGIAAGALSLALLAELHSSDRWLYGRLTGRALPLVVVSAVCGVAAFAMLAAGRPRWVRQTAALGVAAVIWGWGVAQYPVLLPGTVVTLSNAGAPYSTLAAVVVVFIIAVVVVGPSLALLFKLQSERVLRYDETNTQLPRLPGPNFAHPSRKRPP